MNDKKVRVLQIAIGGETYSGVASYLYQYYSHMDRNRVVFDFLFCTQNALRSKEKDEIFRKSNFYVLNAYQKSKKSVDYLKSYHGIDKVLKKYQYDFVVVNTSNIEIEYVALRAAKKNKIPVFIAHAHNSGMFFTSNSLRNRLKPIFNGVNMFCQKNVVKKADYLFACSQFAGKLTFGESAIYMDKFRVIQNGIEVSKFKYNSEIRKKVRFEFGIDDNITIYGNVGKLSEQKNIGFLIQTFSEIHRVNMNTLLWVIGEGENKEVLMELVKSLDLTDYVRFLGERNDVASLMQAMDCFIFPSKGEGLGIVAIEAQAAGLPIFISDAVPKDVMITNFAYQLPLVLGYRKWAEEIMKISLNGKLRENTEKSVMKAGYEINIEAKKMTEFFVAEKRKRKDEIYS